MINDYECILLRADILWKCMITTTCLYCFVWFLIYHWWDCRNSITNALEFLLSCAEFMMIFSQSDIRAIISAPYLFGVVTFVLFAVATPNKYGDLLFESRVTSRRLQECWWTCRLYTYTDIPFICHCYMIQQCCNYPKPSFYYPSVLNHKNVQNPVSLFNH